MSTVNPPRNPVEEFHVGTLAPPSGLDPRTAKDAATHTLLRQIFELPFVIRGGKTVSLLFATELQKLPSPDSRHPVYAAEVVPNRCFSDGTPLTAQIVAESLSRTKAVSDKATVRHDGNRVVFTLKQPNPRFDFVLSQTYCGIVLEKAGALYGTGAFMFERPPTLRVLQGLQSIKLVRNPNFPADPPMNSVVFDIYTPDAGGAPSSLLEACARGDVDFTAALTSLHAASVPLGVVYPSIQSGVSTAFLSFNVESAGLKDPRVRRALAVGLDRTAIVRRSFEKNPLAFVAKGILPPVIEPHEVDLFPFSITEAQRIFDDPAVKKPQSLKLVIPWSPRPYAPHPALVGEEVKRQYAQFGINVDVVTPRGADDYYATLAAGRYDLCFSGWIPDSPDPADTYESMLSSAMIQTPGGSNANANNLSRLRSSALDEAIAQFRISPTEQNRAVITRVVQEEVPLVPVMKGQGVVVLSRRVRNFEPSLDGVYALESLTISK